MPFQSGDRCPAGGADIRGGHASSYGRAAIADHLACAHVRTNAARARTCCGGFVSASIRRIQFLKGNRRRPLWGMSMRRGHRSSMAQNKRGPKQTLLFARYGTPLPARIRGVIDHEEPVKCLKEDRLHAKEVASPNHRCVALEERAPTWRRLPIPRTTPIFCNASGRDPEAKPCQLGVDPPLTHK
jgi:hypothetical protein